jgi:predicted nuclease of predicted toxin-antitoxin system
MRLLLDENTGRRSWCQRLSDAGHDVERVVDVGLRGQPDSAVLEYAVATDRILVTRDKTHDSDDDLLSIGSALPDDKPSILVIFPGDPVTITELLTALARVERSGMARGQLCPVNAWGR